MSASTHYGIGVILPKALSFILLPLFVRFLTPQDYGILEIAGSLGALITILVKLGLPGSIVRFFGDYEQSERHSFIKTIVSIEFLIALIIAATGFSLLPKYSESWLSLIWWPYGALVLSSSILGGLLILQRRILQAKEQAKYTAVLNTVIAGVTLTGNILAVVFLGFRAEGILGVQLIVNLCVTVQIIYYLRDSFRLGAFHLKYIKPCAKYAIGILPTHLINHFSPLFTNVYLASVASVSLVGVLGLANRVVSPLILIITALGTAYTPLYFKFRKKYDEGDAVELQQLMDVAERVLSIGLLVCIGTAICAPSLIQLVFPDKYHEASTLVPILVAVPAITLIHVLISAELFYRVQVYLTIITSILNIGLTVGLTVALAADWGPSGVAIARVAGSFLGAGILISISYAQSPIRLPFKPFVRNIAAGIISVTAFYALNSQDPLTNLMLGLLFSVVYVVASWAFGDQTWSQIRVLLLSKKETLK